MNDRDALLESREELLRVSRDLHSALQEARPYVFQRTAPPGHPEHDWRAETAERILERVDGALADAGELLAGVTS